MTTETGVVLNVAVVPLGSELNGAVSAGATTITLLDGADFSEDGGTIQIGQDAAVELVGYSALDDDTGIMTLATPLVGAYADAIPVLKYPLSVEKFADVQFEAEDEAIEAVVPISLYDRLPEGTRDDATAEQVTVEKPPDSDTYTVVDILGMEPLVDGSFTDPASTIPPAALTDGLAPTAAPTSVTAGAFAIRAGRVSWTPPANPDPMHYRVYVKNAAGVTTADEVAADTYSTSADVVKYGGLPLDPAASYFVAVAAVDADGQGPLSAEASFQPRQAENADMSADDIFAIKIEVAGIQSGVSASDIFVGGSFAVADYDVDGQPIPGTERFLLSGDGSTRWFDADGNERITLDPNTASYVFRGDVEADHLTVTNGSIQGGLNELAEGATLSLQKGVTTPKNPPSATVGYDTLQFAATPVSGLAFDGTNWYTVVAGGRIAKVDAAGAVVATSPTAFTGRLLGLAHNGTHLLFMRASGTAQTGFTYTVHRVRTSDLVALDSSTWPHADGLAAPTIGWDAAAGEILIAQSRATDGKVRVRRYTYNAGGTLTSSATPLVDSGYVYSNDLSSIMFGSFDLGASRYVFSPVGAGFVQVISTAGAEQPLEEWQASAEVVGMHWDGTNFYSLDESGVRRKYEAGAGNRWTTSTDATWYVAYTWYRATGALETLRSPYTTVTMKKRARLIVQTAPLPVGSATPPSEARVYLKKGTTNPGSNPATVNMRRQASSTSGSPPTLTVVDADFGTANNPAASGFGAAGTAAEVHGGDGSLLVSANDLDQAWTPVLTAVTTNPTGYTATGRYKIDGDRWATIDFEIVMPANANAGSGQYVISVPVTLKYVHMTFPIFLRDVSGNDSYAIFGMVDTDQTHLRLLTLPDPTAALQQLRICNASVPVAIGVGDKFSGSIRAEKA